MYYEHIGAHPQSALLFSVLRPYGSPCWWKERRAVRHRGALSTRSVRGSGLGPFEPPLAGINGAILRFIACHRLRRTQVRLHPMPALAPRLASVSAPRATSATARSPTDRSAICRRFPLCGLPADMVAYCHDHRSFRKLPILGVSFHENARFAFSLTHPAGGATRGWIFQPLFCFFVGFTAEIPPRSGWGNFAKQNYERAQRAVTVFKTGIARLHLL